MGDVSPSPIYSSRLTVLPVAVGQIEKDYSIAEFAELLSMSYERVRQLVKDEPGVLQFHPAPSGKRTKRSKTMYRIPESVVQRVPSTLRESGDYSPTAGFRTTGDFFGSTVAAGGFTFPCRIQEFITD